MLASSHLHVNNKPKHVVTTCNISSLAYTFRREKSIPLRHTAVLKVRRYSTYMLLTQKNIQHLHAALASMRVHPHTGLIITAQRVYFPRKLAKRSGNDHVAAKCVVLSSIRHSQTDVARITPQALRRAFQKRIVHMPPVASFHLLGETVTAY